MIGERPRILVVGDVMVDRHVRCSVDRLSPEAPIPIARVEATSNSLGGAANVARQISLLGGEAALVSVWSPETNAIAIFDFDFDTTNAPGDIELRGPTESAGTMKTRYFAGNGHQLLRVDNDVDPSKWSDGTRRKLEEAVRGIIGNVDLVVISDYQKGVVSDELAATIMRNAALYGTPVVVDSKKKGYGVFATATLITPNEAEARAAMGVADGNRAGELLSLDSYGVGNVLLTRSELGVALFSHGERVASFGATAEEVVDVTGAGDVVAGVAAFALASGYDAVDAAYQANIAAGISVGQPGCYQPDLEDVNSVGEYRAKIFSARCDFGHRIGLLRKNYERSQRPFSVVLYNGCFDGLHAGHHRLLAASPPDAFVVVAVNSDDSVKQLKGEDRPLVEEDERMLALAKKAGVDMVILFDTEEQLEATIRLIRPNVIMKGAEYEGRPITGGEFLAEWGGRVEYAPMLEGVSTTILARRGRRATSRSNSGLARWSTWPGSLARHEPPPTTIDRGAARSPDHAR